MGHYEINCDCNCGFRFIFLNFVMYLIKNSLDVTTIWVKVWSFNELNFELW